MTEGATTDAWLRRFWHTPLRRGKRRYYDNCLYFFCLMLLSGCCQLEHGHSPSEKWEGRNCEYAI